MREVVPDNIPMEVVEQRLKEEKPILDALLVWANSVSAAPKSALGKALHYLREQWPYLLRYLVWVLQQAPRLAAKNVDWTEKLTPASAPDDCRVP